MLLPLRQIVPENRLNDRTGCRSVCLDIGFDLECTQSIQALQLLIPRLDPVRRNRLKRHLCAGRCADVHVIQIGNGKALRFRIADHYLDVFTTPRDALRLGTIKGLPDLSCNIGQTHAQRLSRRLQFQYQFITGTIEAVGYVKHPGVGEQRLTHIPRHRFEFLHLTGGQHQPDRLAGIADGVVHADLFGLAQGTRICPQLERKGFGIDALGHRRNHHLDIIFISAPQNAANRRQILVFRAQIPFRFQRLCGVHYPLHDQFRLRERTAFRHGDLGLNEIGVNAREKRRA